MAAFFDDLTGFVLQVAATTAYTGELTVRYLAPVPIGVPLLGRAWLVGRERRKLFVEADLQADGAVVATCKAIFIATAQVPVGSS